MVKDRTYQEDKEKDKVKSAGEGRPEKKIEETLIRIAGQDIVASKKLYSGLTKIKGVSWSLANAICKKIGISKDKRIEKLSVDEKKKIEEFVANPDVPVFLKNRRKDRDTGEDKHLNSSDLDLQKDFDIKRIRKIKSYKGVRHILGLPVRGQRTRSNFRKNRRKSGAVGVSKGGAKRG